MALFSIPRRFYQLTGSIFERERQMLTTHPEAKVQTLFFDNFKTLACTTLLTLDL